MSAFTLTIDTDRSSIENPFGDERPSLVLYPPSTSTRAGRRIAGRIPKHVHPQ